jgi:hypothetical protein
MRRSVAVHDVGLAVKTRRRLDGDAAGTALAEGVGDGLGVDAGDLDEISAAPFEARPRPDPSTAQGRLSACGRGRAWGRFVTDRGLRGGRSRQATQGVLILPGSLRHRKVWKLSASRSSARVVALSLWGR